MATFLLHARPPCKVHALHQACEPCCRKPVHAVLETHLTLSSLLKPCAVSSRDRALSAEILSCDCCSLRASIVTGPASNRNGSGHINRGVQLQDLAEQKQAAKATTAYVELQAVRAMGSHIALSLLGSSSLSQVCSPMQTERSGGEPCTQGRRHALVQDIRQYSMRTHATRRLVADALKVEVILGMHSQLQVCHGIHDDLSAEQAGASCGLPGYPSCREGILHRSHSIPAPRQKPSVSACLGCLCHG